jgi:hypothetical protein
MNDDGLLKTLTADCEKRKHGPKCLTCGGFGWVAPLCLFLNRACAIVWLRHSYRTCVGTWHHRSTITVALVPRLLGPAQGLFTGKQVGKVNL